MEPGGSDGAAGGLAVKHLVRTSAGATVLMDVDHPVNGASVHLATPSGDDSGTGHLLEHMVFRDPSAGADGDLYAEMMFAGPAGEMNASTLSTQTTYHLTTSTPDGRDAALLRLMRAILHPALDPRHLAEERAIVASEMEGFWADPMAAALEGLRALALPGERAGHAGLPGQVARLTPQDLRDFRQRHYRASRLMLHLTGVPPGPAFWPSLDAILSSAPSPPPKEPGKVKPASAGPALPMALPPDLGLPGLAWLLPGLGPRAVEVLRATTEALLPEARSRGSVVPGCAELRLAGPPMAAEEAAGWLARAMEICTGPALPGALRAQARLALVRGTTLADRRAAVVQAWQGGADLSALPMEDEIPRLLAWAEAQPREIQALATALRQPVVAHVFRAGQELPEVSRLAQPPALAPATARSRRPVLSDGPRLRTLSLAHLPQADLPTAGALLRGLAARDGALVTPLTPGPHVALTLAPRANDPFVGDIPPLTPPPTLPLHLRIERRLWGALTPEGASLAALEGEAAPSAAGRIWRDLRARDLTSDLTPTRAAPRPTVPLAEPDQPMPGRLSTLGLGLAMGDAPILPLIAHALEWQWLRQTVRRKGGAYGVRCRVGPGGALVFLAARDPAPPEATLARFAESAEWLRQSLRGDLLAQAIRGTLEKLPRLPDTPWELQLAEWQAKLDPTRAPDRLRAAIADATERQVAALADRLDQAMARAVRLVFRGSG